jgi:hypothetical protein
MSAFFARRGRPLFSIQNQKPTDRNQPMMNLEESDLKLLHDIANRRALLQGPPAPLLLGTLAATMRRRRQWREELTQLEQQWLERGLSCAGLPGGLSTGAAAPLTQRDARAYRGADRHHF